MLICLWNGFSKTPERDEQFNLSIPYMKNEQIILVKTDSDYQTLEDLAGKTIGVQADSSAESAWRLRKTRSSRIPWERL